MSRLTALLLTAALLASCQQTAPIYDPPPGGHDALSRPPAALIQPPP